MRDRSPFLPALVAVGATAAATLAPVLGVASPAAADRIPSTTVRTTSAVAAPVQAPGDEPLQVSLDTLTPGYLPTSGRVELTGTVTNVSEERWRNIKVYSFIDDVPLTSSAELAATADTPVDAEVGDRITTDGTFDDIGGLAPGQTASYSLSLRRSQIPVAEPGAYWFGTHALGNTRDVRDSVADGRARTLLPLVPEDVEGTEKAAVVVPLRHSVRHAPDGRLRSPHRWARDLGAGGRLRSLVDLGTAAGDAPVTWLVDPAVPDAVARLVAGNPGRSLDEVLPPPAEDGQDGEEGQDGDGSEESDAPGDGEPSSEIVEPGDDAGGSQADNPAAVPGGTWLSRLQEGLREGSVLTLPYGDPDVAATHASAPQFYERAATRPGDQLSRWEVRSTPAVAPPEGYLPADAMSLLQGEETVILTDRAIQDDAVRAAGLLGRQRVLFASADTAAGGPGPGDPLGELALRQRILAEAAVRLLFHDRTPLLTVVPDEMEVSSPSTFWEGLDEVPWLRLTDTDGLGGGDAQVPAEDLRYPVEQELTELDPENFTSAERLIAAGSTLDNVLPRNNLVAGQTLVEALTSLSYTERARAVEARRATDLATTWVERRLERVRLRAPGGVTLSSSEGDFFTTVTNRLDHPVTVLLHTISMGAVDVADSEPIQLPAGGRQTVPLTAEASRAGVHYVEVTVTDEAGNALGASQRVAIRSAEVSQVIWLILGVGVGLLFLAIGIRLVRRVRSERA